MTRSLSPFWPLDWWSAWWDTWGSAPYVAPLRDSSQARTLAQLHATSFARPWEVHEFERLLCERSTAAHGLWRGGLVHGFVLSRKAADEAELLTIVIAPSFRGSGLSHRLLREHLTALSFAGVRRIHLEVDEGNAAALKLYAAQGFERVGERTGYYTKSDGTRATALTMRASLV